MKPVIKILLIALVVAGISALVYLFVKKITEPEMKIAVTEFEKYIKDRSDREIKGKDYYVAKKAFDSIFDEIANEASIVYDDGTKPLRDSERRNSQVLAYDEYVPIFVNFGENYFKNSYWDQNELKNLRSESKKLLSLNLSDNGILEIRKISDYVDDYFAALAVVSRSKTCTSVSAVDRLVSDANNYKRYPFTNNDNLMRDLNSVRENAKNSIADYIIRQCNRVITKLKNENYSSYSAFNSDLNAVNDKINEFNSKFGSGRLSDMQNELNEWNTVAKEFFRGSQSSGSSDYDYYY